MNYLEQQIEPGRLMRLDAPPTGITRETLLPFKLIVPERPEFIVEEDPPLMLFSADTVNVAYHILLTAQSDVYDGVEHAKELVAKMPVQTSAFEETYFTNEWSNQNTGEDYY